MTSSCSTSVTTENIHKSVEHILAPVKDETVFLCQPYIHVFTAFMQTNTNNHLSGMESSIIHKVTPNICVASAWIDKLLFPKGFFVVLLV